MAVTKIRVNTNQLFSEANSVTDCIRIADSELAMLEEHFAVLDTMWDGPASEAFRIAYHDDIEALRGVIENLSQFNQFELNAGKQYENCETEVNGIVNSLNW